MNTWHFATAIATALVMAVMIIETGGGGHVVVMGAPIRDDVSDDGSMAMTAANTATSTSPPTSGSIEADNGNDDGQHKHGTVAHSW